jgi:hypothetical protein
MLLLLPIRCSLRCFPDFYTEIMENHSFNKALFIVGNRHDLSAKEEKKTQ